MKMVNVPESVETVPNNANVVSSRFHFKRNHKGEIVKRKFRLVAKGYPQQKEFDFHETFSPTLRKWTQIRIFRTLAAQNEFNIHQINVNAAYLNDYLNEKAFIKPPKRIF